MKASLERINFIAGRRKKRLQAILKKDGIKLTTFFNNHIDEFLNERSTYSSGARQGNRNPTEENRHPQRNERATPTGGQRRNGSGII